MSLVARPARNHRQKPVDDTIDDRRTPREFFDPLHAQHRFTVDAAASEANALLPRFWTREDDALAQPWDGERVWCNPPFSRLEPWLEKAWRETMNDCPVVVMLLPANRCEQGFWQRHVEPYRDLALPRSGVLLRVRFLANRLRFGYPEGKARPVKGDRPPFGLVLLTWERAA